MSTEDLATSLFLNQVDAQELSQIVLETFGAEVFESTKEVMYHRTNEPPALRFLYEGGVLTRIEKGIGLLDGDVCTIQQKIKADLLDTTRRKICRIILFSDYPVNGYVKIPNLFQICPVPLSAPRPKEFLEGNNPFLIEFEVTHSPNQMILSQRGNVRAQRFSLLLNTFAQGRVIPRSKSTPFRWVKTNFAGQPYQRLPEDYSYDGFETWSDSFTPCEGIPEIERIERIIYFRGNESTPGPFRLPDNFEQLIASFFKLALQSQEKFIRAAYWYRLSQHEVSYSALYLHLILCIETLFPEAESGRVCPECKRNIGKGPTQQFADFLDEMVPAHPELASGRKRLYKFRSDLTHGWDLFAHDLGEYGDPKSADDVLKALEAFQLARLTLINWLIKQGRSH